METFENILWPEKVTHDRDDVRSSHVRTYIQRRPGENMESECNGEHEAMECDLAVSEVDPRYVSQEKLLHDVKTKFERAFFCLPPLPPSG